LEQEEPIMAKATTTEDKNKGKAGVKSAKPVRKGEGGKSTDGLHRALKVSPELGAVIGTGDVARADAVSKFGLTSARTIFRIRRTGARSWPTRSSRRCSTRTR
jgi:hypothetical protein